MEEIQIAPEDAGLERAPLKVVTGGDVAENAARFTALLAGRGTKAEEDIVVLNTAVLLETAGKVGDLREGAAAAQQAIASGAAARALDRYVEASRG
jgi:anthranilate phosphoribosyltransferase